MMKEEIFRRGRAFSLLRGSKRVVRRIDSLISKLRKVRGHKQMRKEGRSGIEHLRDVLLEYVLPRWSERSYCSDKFEEVAFLRLDFSFCHLSWRWKSRVRHLSWFTIEAEERRGETREVQQEWITTREISPKIETRVEIWTIQSHQTGTCIAWFNPTILDFLTKVLRKGGKLWDGELWKLQLLTSVPVQTVRGIEWNLDSPIEAQISKPSFGNGKEAGKLDCLVIVLTSLFSCYWTWQSSTNKHDLILIYSSIIHLFPSIASRRNRTSWLYSLPNPIKLSDSRRSNEEVDSSQTVINRSDYQRVSDPNHSSSSQSYVLRDWQFLWRSR